MIGNAVPVKLAEAVATKLMECLMSNSDVAKEVAISK